MRNSCPALLLICECVALALSSGCGNGSKPPGGGVVVDAVRLQLFEPLPEVMPSKTNTITEEKTALGRMLYYEPRLSRSQQISCNSCHILTRYGVDGEPTSDGHQGKKGDRNSPTVYNAAGHFAQFWDGRAQDVEEQAKGPVMNPAEMAMKTEVEVVAVLKSMPEYLDAFKRAFPGEKDPINCDNMAQAIGAFERKLVTPAPWDHFLRGDRNALTNEQKAGFNVYVAAGCQTCHVGAFLGGNLFQKLGVAKTWPDPSDPGRQKVTKNDADLMIFKVPSLRNIEKTGPYYHNGRIGTLEEAVAKMAEYQLGKQLSPEEVKSITLFLKSLTGELPAEYIKEPALPKSAATTPKPDLSD